MEKRVTIVDYGVGNLYSVGRALETQGAKVSTSDSPEEIFKADYVVFPGVGAFKRGVESLNSRGLFGALKEYCTLGRPFLGLCLGMQIMFTKSHEFELTNGLDIIPGEVKKIPVTSIDGHQLKVPHIGWNSLNVGRPWTGSLLGTTKPGSYVYFVHSFAATPDRPEDTLAFVEYGGHRITAAVAKGNVMGCQFHPERSGQVGLNMLQTFLNL